jgi:8-oxo-dGTP pyrophosphatase MutT (NUDIX family)
MADLLPWQLFDNQGQPIAGKGAHPDDIFANTLLHAAVHIWIWRDGDNGPEIMLQKRSARVKSFPGLLDISAAGHIDVGEQPLETAAREVQEEIGLQIDANDLWLVGVFRTFMEIHSGFNKGKIENEFRFVYLLKVTEDQDVAFTDGEVHSVLWKSLSDIQADLAGRNQTAYVPHSPAYFSMFFAGLETYQKANARAARRPTV